MSGGHRLCADRNGVENEDMAASLFELMKPEIDQYTDKKIKEREIEHVKAMILHGDDNAYIHLIMNMPEEEIDNVRKSMK